jgi:hypothetical protein
MNDYCRIKQTVVQLQEKSFDETGNKDDLHLWKCASWIPPRKISAAGSRKGGDLGLPESLGVSKG